MVTRQAPSAGTSAVLCHARHVPVTASSGVLEGERVERKSLQNLNDVPYKSSYDFRLFCLCCPIFRFITSLPPKKKTKFRSV